MEKYVCSVALFLAKSSPPLAPYYPFNERRRRKRLGLEEGGKEGGEGGKKFFFLISFHLSSFLSGGDCSFARSSTSWKNRMEGGGGGNHNHSPKSQDQRSEAMLVNAPMDAEKKRHILVLSTTFSFPHKT